MLWVVELIFNLTRESICGEAPATRSNDREGGYRVVCRIGFYFSGLTRTRTNAFFRSASLFLLSRKPF